jgi:hypothetical protein
VVVPGAVNVTAESADGILPTGNGLPATADKLAEPDCMVKTEIEAHFIFGKPFSGWYWQFVDEGSDPLSITNKNCPAASRVIATAVSPGVRVAAAVGVPKLPSEFTA